MKVPFGLHKGITVAVPREDFGSLSTATIIGHRRTGKRVWGVEVEFPDGRRDFIGILFVRKVK